MPNVIAYGCFINERSLYKTISPRKIKIVTVNGFKRIFNLIPSRMELYKNKADNIHRTVFNVFQDENHSLNAIMFEVNDDEFELLKLRERSYNTKKIKVKDNENNEHEAYIFVGKKKLFGEEILNDSLLPIHPYLKLCIEGAKNLSNEFYEKWLDTSYLGNNTLLRDYIKEQNL